MGPGRTRRGGGIVTVLEAVYAKIGYPKSILVDQGTNFA